MAQKTFGFNIPLDTSLGGTGATSAAAALTSLGAVAKAGDTMTGLLVLSGDPVTALGAVTKQYADAISAGLDFKDACYAMTTGNLTATYANGAAGVGATLTNSGAMAAFSTDGVSPPINSRILVPFQTASEECGIYTLTTVGSGAVNWVLTRATDFDTPAEIPQGAWTIINNGTLYSTTSWVQTAVVATIGTDPITFSQFTAGVGANTTLSNLGTTAINDDLVPDTDIIHNLGSPSLRWGAIYAQGITTGDTIGDVLNIAAVDTDTGIPTAFMVLTAGSTPTAALTSSVTGVTQAPGTNTTQLATTAFVIDAVSTSAALKANVALDNLAAVAINTSLTPGVDGTPDLGSVTKRFDSAYVNQIRTNTTAGQDIILQGRDTNLNTWVDILTITAGNPPTAVLSGTVTGVTQAALDNSLKLATTAYVDAATGGGSGANTSLSNLSAVAINTSLISDTDLADDLGSTTIRWDNVFAETLSAGHTIGHVLNFSARDVDGGATIDFITATSSNTPTCTIAGSVTGVTQSPGTNNTQLATCAYADASSAARANVALSNLSGVAINTTLVSDTDNTDDLGSASIRWANIYGINYRTGTTNTNAMILQGRNTGGGTWADFITITAAATATCAISGATITGGTVGSLASPIAVASGGLGVASTTAYAVLCGGTTSTNPVQSIASVGNAGEVLTSNGAGALPTFQAAAGGSGALTLLLTQTASGAATVDFSSTYITSTYESYLLTFTRVNVNTSGSSLWARVATGGTWKSGASDYRWVAIAYNSISSSEITSDDADSEIQLNGISTLISTTTLDRGNGQLYIHSIADASFPTAINGQMTYVRTGNYMLNASFGGMYQTVEANDGFRIMASGGNISGVFKLYGIKSS